MEVSMKDVLAALVDKAGLLNEIICATVVKEFEEVVYGPCQ